MIIFSLAGFCSGQAFAGNSASMSFSGFSHEVLRGNVDDFSIIGTNFFSSVYSSSAKNVNYGQYLADQSGDQSYLTDPTYDRIESVVYDSAQDSSRYTQNPNVSSDGGGYASAFADVGSNWTVEASAANASNDFGGSSSSGLQYYFRIDLAPNAIVALNFDLIGHVISNPNEAGDSAKATFDVYLDGQSYFSPYGPVINQDYSYTYSLDTTSNWFQDFEELNFNESNSIALSGGKDGAYFWGIMVMNVEASNYSLNAVTSVPEPQNAAILMLGLGSILMLRRRKFNL